MDGMLDRRRALAAGIGGAAALAGGAGDARGQAADEPILTTWPADSLATVTQGTNFALAPSPDGSRFAIDVAGMISLVPASGGEAEPLTPPILDASQPDWTPDGAALVFQAYTEGFFQLWRVEAKTRELRRLTSGRFDHREPAVSPDGAAVAFVTDRSGRCRVEVLDLASGGTRPWADFPGEAAQPAWSPDGRSITCVADGRRILAAEEGGPVRELASAPRGGGTLARSLVAGPAFTPDGKAVAYVEVRQAQARLRVSDERWRVEDEDVFPFRPRWLAGGLMAYSADGSIRLRRAGGPRVRDVPFSLDLPLARREPRRPPPSARRGVSRPVRGIAAPALAPDGGTLAFRALNALWLLEPGGSPRAIVDDGFCAADPAWSPDGRQLAYANDRGGTLDVWLWDRASGESRQLTRHAAAVAGPAWSPDGTRIAFIDHAGALSVCSASDGAVRRVQDPIFMPGKPSWSPDGRTLALAALAPASARFREGTNQVLLVDVASGKGRYLPLPGGTSIATRGDDGPAWSPDGRSLALVIASRLWLWPVGPDGTPEGPPRRLNDEVTDAPAWAADGASLIYLSGGRVRRIPVSGGSPRTIPVRLTWAEPRRPRPLVIRAGRLWDGLARTARGPSDITVLDGAIASVAPAGGDPPGPGADFVDARDLMAMPGLVDAHAHVQMQGYGFGDREGRLWLSFGVTTIRSLAGPAQDAVEYREAVAAGRRVGPRLFATGEAIDGPRVYYHMMRPLDEPDQLARELDRARALSYDVMKCYVRLPAGEVRQVTLWAHRRGLPVTSHYLYPAMLFGVDGIEHMGATNKLGYARTVSLTGRVYQDVDAVLARTGASRVPTLFQASALYREDPALLEDERIRLLLPPWERRRLVEQVRGLDDATFTAMTRILENNVAHLRRLAELGGLVVAGTDAPIDITASSLHMNLRGMVRYGMSPVDALFTATRNAGKMLNARIGTLERGARADISLVEGDPLARIEDAARVRRVVADGVSHDIDALIAPFRGTRPSPEPPRADASLPASPFWWHERAFVARAGAGCCDSHG